MRSLYWRILRDHGGRPATLFHGINGSRYLELDTWHRARVRVVTDGTRTQSTPYYAGFHVMETFKEVLSYSQRFTNIADLVIVQVAVGGVCWYKQHSPDNVRLTSHLMIPSEQWEIRRQVCPSLWAKCERRLRNATLTRLSSWLSKTVVTRSTRSISSASRFESSLQAPSHYPSLTASSR